MRKITIISIIALLLVGCEEYSTDGYLDSVPDTYVTLMEEGWLYFLEGDFNASIDRFRTAADRDATKPEPYLGLGWSYARDEAHNLDRAISNFQKTQNFSSFADAELEVILINESTAGLAIVNYALGEYAIATAFAQEVIDAKPDFEMRSDPSVSAASLHAMQLYCETNLGNVAWVFEELLAADLVFETVETAQATIQVDIIDDLLGIHEGTITLPGSAAGLITITAVSADIAGLDNPLPYVVDDVVEGGNTFTFQGIPFITDNEVYVTYVYAQDYGSFLDELLEYLSTQ